MHVPVRCRLTNTAYITPYFYLTSKFITALPAHAKVFGPLAMTGTIVVRDAGGEQLHNANIHTHIVGRYSKTPYPPTTREMLLTATNAYYLRHRSTTLKTMRDALHDLLETKSDHCAHKEPPANDTCGCGQEGGGNLRQTVTATQQHLSDYGTVSLGALTVHTLDRSFNTQLPAAHALLRVPSGETLDLFVFAAPISVSADSKLPKESHMHAVHFLASSDTQNTVNIKENDSACGVFKSRHSLGKTPSNQKFENMAQFIHSNARRKVFGRGLPILTTNKHQLIYGITSNCSNQNIVSFFWKLY